MFKRTFMFLIILVLLLASIPVMASEQPAVYSSTITVTEDGGKYQIGFINVEFKKDSLDLDKLPITFDVQIYAENGIRYIEFTPDIPDFYKKVHISIDRFKGELYDRATGENIPVDIKKQQILAGHFSRYAF